MVMWDKVRLFVYSKDEQNITMHLVASNNVRSQLETGLLTSFSITPLQLAEAHTPTAPSH